MDIEATSLPEVIKITPARFGDNRGYFSELYREDLFGARINDVHFVQDNQSLSWQLGTVRGLHFQHPPFEQGKLVRVVTGAIFDVAVDIRIDSPTFGQWAGAHLSADNGAQLWIPEGFAHGFMTLQPNTIINYKVTASYSALHEGGILWNDPDIGIDWPFTQQQVQISSRDSMQPRLHETFVRPLTEVGVDS